jgi:hypothetical protein
MVQNLGFQLQNTFSTRELALFTWLFLLLLYMISNKKLRDSLEQAVRIFFNKKLFTAFLLLLIYVVAVVFVLFKFEIWDIFLLKDTCFWFVSSAMILFFSIDKAKNIGFFKSVIVDNLKFILILEYLLNFYTYSFIVEFILLPVTTFLTVLHAFSELPSQQKDKNSKKVISLLKNVLIIIGLIMVGSVIYKTIEDYKSLMTVFNLKALLLPLVLTMLTSPYFYFLTLFMVYENVFVSINCFFRDKEPQIKRKIKFRITFFANLNLNRISKVQGKRLSKIAYFEGNLDNHLKRMFEKPLHKEMPIDSKTKIPLFNDIEKTRYLLSQNGIGNLSEWENFWSDEFQSITTYYTIDPDYSDSPTVSQNNIAYYLIGVETYIERLELVLNLNNTNESVKAISVFKEFIMKTSNVLELEYPSLLLNHVDRRTATIVECDTCFCKLNLHEYERISVWEFIIETKFNIQK